VDVADTLRADPATRDIPVIISTVRALTDELRNDLQRRGLALMSKEALANHDGAAEVRRALVQSGIEV
jgi:CheY-like chemotaxis protein